MNSRRFANAVAGAAACLAMAATSLPAGADAAPAAYTVRYGFDGGASNLDLGVAGEPLLTSASAKGGSLRTIAHGDGDALEFPAPCPHPGATSCPRTIVETVGSDSALNPGTRPVSYGATVRLGSHKTTDGENILQKGYATDASEFKLQVDGAAGKPSCAVVGTASAHIYLAKSSVAIDNGAWHTLACERSGSTLSILVDGVTRGSTPVPASVNVTNADALRMGGKGTSANNDQFDGSLDDVWVTVG